MVIRDYTQNISENKIYFERVLRNYFLMIDTILSKEMMKNFKSKAKPLPFTLPDLETYIREKKRLNQ